MFKKNIECPKCGKYYDAYETMCPNCQNETDSKEAKKTPKNILMLSLFSQMGFFLLGWLGLSLVSTFVILIYANVVCKNYGLTSNEFIGDLNSYPDVVLNCNVITYLIIFAGMILILIPSFKSFFKSLKNYKTYIVGFLMGIVLIIANLLVSYLITMLSESSGNNNQSMLEQFIGLNPVLCLIIFGFVGPIVEEFTYRLGLFSLLNRTGKIWVAYVVTILVFALIHFDFSSSNIVNELINLPPYLVAGAILCLAYHYGGFTASTIAHVMNNVLSISMIIISQLG